MKTALLAALLAAVSAQAFAQSAGPAPLPLPPPVEAPQDKPYPGTLKLFIDATDLDRRIFRVKETIPVAGPGPLTLLFPMWLPGNHSASGQLDKLAGLIITANGQRLEWTRDPVTVAAFRVNVPVGVKAVDLEFQYLSPTTSDQGRVVVTQEMLNLQWNNMLLYPAGYFTRQIPIAAQVKLPTGWNYGTALETGAINGDTVTFKTVGVDTLVDSPIFSGKHFKKIDLDPGGRSRVTLNLMADEAFQLDMSPAQLQAHRNLIVQADHLYGARHFDHYDMLLALTERMGGIGLEHQRSSENGSHPRYFVDWEKLPNTRDLLPHEYAHSWNGKYRRPADLWTANFNTPMRGSLLWVYEGQTQYWGYVLAARSSLLTKQEALDAIAATAALYDNRVGRVWRQVGDTTNDPVIAQRRPQGWTSWQRSEDYYSEGQLIWLDADTLIREKTGGAKSLDTFAKAFFGVNDGDWGQLTYKVEDVVSTLNGVLPYDWANFLKTRLEGHGPGAPLDGLARGGYRLAYKETPTPYFISLETRRKSSDLTYSLGLSVTKDGDLQSVFLGGSRL